MPDHPPNTSDASDNPTTTDAATEEIVIDDIEAEAGFLDDRSATPDLGSLYRPNLYVSI